MKIGSPEHKELFCRSFIDSFLPYEPEDLAWPELDEESIVLLRSVPVWTMALEVEVNAGMMLDGFAKTQSDPLIREALALQGYEETRHGRMLRELIKRYGLSAGPIEPSMPPARSEFVKFGYNECLDSLFGFGIFRLACEARIVPESLTTLFARVLIEEARHIVFFVNWIAYERAQRGFGAPVLQAIPTALGYLQALRKTIGRATQAKVEDRGMAAAGEVFRGLTLKKFLVTCLEENERYMAAFDPRLLRPRVMPAMARIVLTLTNTGSRIRDVARKGAARS
jgi:hypothetical protein